MNRYTKIINMMDSYYTKDYEKTKYKVHNYQKIQTSLFQKQNRG